MQLYNQEYYEAVAEGLKSHGWREVADFNGRDAVNGKYDKVRVLLIPSVRGFAFHVGTPWH